MTLLFVTGESKSGNEDKVKLPFYDATSLLMS